jgi:hypothetical protein
MNHEVMLQEDIPISYFPVLDFGMAATRAFVFLHNGSDQKKKKYR